jgi:hypothetical protein
MGVKKNPVFYADFRSEGIYQKKMHRKEKVRLRKPFLSWDFRFL